MKALTIFAVLAVAAPAFAGDAALELTVGGRTATETVDGRSVYTYSWPGIYFEANFTGSAVEAKVDDDKNNLYLYVDGVHKLTLTKPGKTSVVLKDLGDGRHSVRLEKASETQGASGRFEGFFVDTPAQSLPPPHYDRNIEFIGDSFTVGYGNTSRGRTCTTEDVAETTDTSRAFAPLTAKRLKAGYRIIASSGHGIVRNYNNFDPGMTMPFLYDYTLYDLKDRADDAGWSPDAIAIYLGTNDFSTPLKDDEPWKTREDLRADFVQTYIAFVQKLHKMHPRAHFLLLGTVTADHEMLDQVRTVGAGLDAAGVTDFEIVPVEGLEFAACHGHPSLKDDGILSRLLIDRLETLPAFAATAKD